MKSGNWIQFRIFAQFSRFCLEPVWRTSDDGANNFATQQIFKLVIKLVINNKLRELLMAFPDIAIMKL